MGKNTQTRWLGSDGYWQVKLDCGAITGEHRQNWEAANGPIPPGYQIHHINGIRTDNRLENLECVDPQTHKRLHVGHRWVEGAWVKTCTRCGWSGPEDRFPTKCWKAGQRMTRGNCTECERTRIREKSRRRRELERARAN